MPRYRRPVQTVETIAKLSYEEKRVYPIRGQGTAKVEDRYHHSGPSYPIPNPGYPFSHIVANKDWQQPIIEPLRAIRIDLQQPYGSRYRVAGIGSSPNKVVVIQNPVGPLQPTDRGYKTVENNARLGSFMAQMNAAAVARKRR